MPVIRRTIMPNKPLTNQELLKELDRRIQQGTIAWKVKSQTQADDPLTAQLFKVRVSKVEPKIKAIPEKTEEEVETSDNCCSNQGLFSNTWLWVVLALGAVWFISKRSFTTRTEVGLVDKSFSPMNDYER